MRCETLPQTVDTVSPECSLGWTPRVVLEILKLKLKPSPRPGQTLETGLVYLVNFML